MKIKAIYGIMMAWLLAFSALAQDLTTADAVLDKYFAAVGGKEKLRTIQDMTTAATTDIQGRTLEMETKLKMPNKYKQVSYMMGNEAGGATYDGSTLSRSMRGQQTTKQGKEAMMEFLHSHPFTELYYDTLGVAVSYTHLDVYKRQTYRLLPAAREPGCDWVDLMA